MIDSQLHSQLMDISHNITHLENTITNVANWMSSNFLFLNPSKTDRFLIFGLPDHNNSPNSIILPFIYYVILSTVDSARNLDVIFDKNLSFAQHISSISKSASFVIIRDLRRIRNTIDQTILPAPLLILSFILKLLN